MMQTKEFSLNSVEGQVIKGEIYRPEKTLAIMYLVHGIGEYSARYDAWIQRFNKQHIAVITYDHVGHGRSGGKRGHISNYLNFIEDLEVVIRETQKEFHEIPVVLYGHSMGGSIVLNYALRKQHQSLFIVSSPWLELANQPPKWQTLLGSIVNILYPSITMTNGIKSEQLVRDTSTIEEYKEDPLIHNRISARLFAGAQKAGAWLLENSKNLATDLLLMHGTKDVITSYKASIKFAEQSKKHTHLKIWEGFYHELHHEQERDKVFNYIMEWLSPKLSL